MDSAVFHRLESYIAQGRVILFTGAGFSLGAADQTGASTPSVGQLTAELWDIAFPGEDHDGSELQDVFDAGLLQARNRVVDLVTTRLTVDPESVPRYYYRWFALPWFRIYTLNIDTLAQAANVAFDLPRPLQPVSALSDTVPSPSEEGLTVVHLNGLLNDLPDVTFSGRQYGERQATPDIWYANLARELISHPVLFVGTTLDEPPLWQYVEARGTRKRAGRELRPGSLLLSPHLPRARAVSLKQYQVDWVKGTAESFEADTLQALDDAGQQGLRNAHLRGSREQAALLPLDETAQSDSLGDEREFLHGREPLWSDVTEGFAIERTFDRLLLASTEADHPSLVVVTGTAGSGKSTSAMRLVLALQARGRSALRLNGDADLRAYKVRRAVEAARPDVLFVPELDRFGKSTRDVLQDVAEAVPDTLIIGTIRSPRYEALNLSRLVSDRPDAVEAVAPPLEDEDIDALLDALTRANRLGTLKGKGRSDQRDVFARKCGRQLLVAMIEATSGERFEAKVESECRELSPEAALVYAVVALAMNFRVRLQDSELLAAVGGEPAAQIRVIDGLTRTHLLTRDTLGRVQLRHRVIAERAVDFFRAGGLVETPLKGLSFALAADARPGQLRASPQGRGVIRLLNHTLLIEFLRDRDGSGCDVVAVRGIYEEIESLLAQDHHFWLQRGSFETEEGDLSLAKNFIEQARALAPNDPYVRTQWAYMTLKRASRNPASSQAAESVEGAFAELDEVIGSRGRKDSYPFHVYGSQGLAWVNRAGLAKDEAERLLQTLRRVVAEGIELHPSTRELRQLARDLEAAYLRLAVRASE